MSSQYKGRMAELYQDFDEVVDRLTYKDLIWLICFVQGYHAGSQECLQVICISEELLQEIRKEAIYMTHENQRLTPNNNRKRKLKSAYTQNDYIEGTGSPEDAIIEALDTFNGLSLGEFN
jgi:hypothetical protein